jgi:hypothetical protein
MRYGIIRIGLAQSAGPFYGSTAMIQVPSPRMAWTRLRPRRDPYPNGEEGKIANRRGGVGLHPP